MYYLITNGIPSPLVNLAAGHVSIFVNMALIKSKIVLEERRVKRIRAKAHERLMIQYPNKRLTIEGSNYVH